MFLDGIKIKSFRSFDSDGISLENFGKINFFIGKNNCGKSNVLKFINLLPKIFSNLKSFPIQDYNNFNEKGSISFALLYNKDSNLTAITEKLNQDLIQFFLNVEVLQIDYTIKNKKSGSGTEKIILDAIMSGVENILPRGNELSDLCLKLFQGASDEESNIKSIMNSLKIPKPLKVCFINNFRRIEPNIEKKDKTSEFYLTEIYNGFDLVG